MVGNLSKTVQRSFPTIEIVSNRLLIESFNLAIDRKKYSLDWDEEQISQYLIDLMEESNLRVKFQLTIQVERKLNDSTKLPIGTNHPKKLPRIDIGVVSWFFKKGIEQRYFFEAKNLYETNYKTRKTSKYLNRYIDTGIESFRTNKYTNGALVGYVLNGTPEGIVSALNVQLLKNRKHYKASSCLKQLEKMNLIIDYPHIYKSTHIDNSHSAKRIQHIFLDFYNT